ncbi:MAG: site-specific tyrosine recombinase XerC [Pseudoxanthomonas suwonensis]|nr:site-specific tyrosine recombinase XerC [Pseudoxanthomonas suwonensis]MDO5505082.1 site-specific tyrosine recombinase XerC [Pseudoxanthomonas suwonensis]
MPRRGQRIKTRKAAAVKPSGPRTRRDDPLAAHPLTRYMHAHFEWMLTHGYSADTVRARRIALRRFIGWCAERDLNDVRAITAPVLERYQRHLFLYRKPDGQPLTLGSQHGCLAPLKTWFKWLVRERHIAFNPASELQLPKQPKRLPRSLLAVADVEAILHEAEPATPAGLRDRAMLELLYATGLRRMEVPALARYDVDLNRRLVFVREGKGRKDRVVPMGERAAAWLDKYLVEARPQLLAADTDALFVTDYGEPISPAWLAEKVKRYMAFAGIDRPGATHLFRHACATHMLENGADIRYIQDMLGHAHLATTEIYTHVAIDKLQRIHAATHPAGRLERRTADTEVMP